MREGGLPSLDQGHRPLECLTSGVEVARVLESAAELAVSVALERGGEVDGRCDGAGHGIGGGPGVDAEGFEAHWRWEMGDLRSQITVSRRGSIAAAVHSRS